MQPEIPPAEPPGSAPPAAGMVFTHDGCRVEIRLGALLILAAVFLWLLLGPRICTLIYLLGLPLFVFGVVAQARDARNRGRPGYPLRLGLILTIGALAMTPDLIYRETVGGPLGIHPMAPMLGLAGLWILFLAPFARPPRTPLTPHP